MTVEVVYEVRQLYSVPDTSNARAAVAKVQRAHSRGDRPGKPLLGAESGVYGGAGITTRTVVVRMVPSKRDRYADLVCSEYGGLPFA